MFNQSQFPSCQFANIGRGSDQVVSNRRVSANEVQRGGDKLAEQAEVLRLVPWRFCRPLIFVQGDGDIYSFCDRLETAAGYSPLDSANRF